jgi:glycosyltransferase involved in cell wall biosynthesis
MIPSEAARDRPFRLALVLWSGRFGGAETFTVALARALRQEGADARLVFVTNATPLVTRVRAAGIPFETLDLKRGRAVILHPRRLGRAIRQAGVDGAILVSGDYLAAALRIGGYGGKIVAVEHGSVLQLPRMRRHQRFVRTAARLPGAPVVDVRVAVSDFVSSRLNGSAPVVTIPNAVDLEDYPLSTRDPDGDEFVIGCMARLVQGKGVEDLLAASAKILERGGCLRIAGDGPERPRLEALARHLGVGDQVEFRGWVAHASGFWSLCDVAVVPSHELVESFGLAALEAMATGRPVVATLNGGLPELVVDGKTGFTVPPGDTDALAAAMRAYEEDPSLRAAHGAAGRARSEARFDIRRCAEAYLALFDDVGQA